MPLVCRKCTRVNPADALYCYHDGAPLDGQGRAAGPVAVGAQRFHVPFVFPSGKICNSFDELVLTCESNWNEAKEILKQGYLEGFLGGLGRADLARTARHAAQTNDGDRGVEEFLSKLPASTRQPPRLVVRPLEINLGQLSRDRDQRVMLEISNHGMGLLTGSVSCADTDWLSVGEGVSSSRKLFQLRTELTLPIRVVSKFLRAGSKKLEGRLNIETNGGGATILVRADVPVIPFTEGVLAGALKPREIASKAKLAPKEAAPLFENGAVARWYERNGWTYPVAGPSASGLAAVQQFFEALGLVIPPRVELDKQSIVFAGAVGAPLREEIMVHTAEKRPVFAHASSSVPWLKVGTVSLEGRVARIGLAIPAVPAMPGERLDATVHVTANGNQRFDVPVSLYVAGQPSGRARSSNPVPDMPVAGTLPTLAALDARRPMTPIEIPFSAARDNPPPAAMTLLPSMADLHGSSAPVARLIPLPDGPGESVMVLSVDPDAPPALRGTVSSERPTMRPNGMPTAVRMDPADRDETGPRRTPFWVHLLPLAFLFGCLMVPLGRDLLARRAPGFGELGAEDLDSSPRIGLHFHDQRMRVTLGSGGVKPQDGRGTDQDRTRPAFWEPSMRFGLVMLNQPDPRKPGSFKRLTFAEDGATNNAVVKLDGNEWLFGDRPFVELDGNTVGAWPGRWLRDQFNLRLPETPYSVQGRKSAWIYDDQKVVITQFVEIVRGTQSNLLDTCLVRYQMHNRDSRPHRVGLRFLLDTFIGSNDGVPFLIPGASAMCEASMDFRNSAQLPDFIQACENRDLANPGTIAQVGLRVPGIQELPSRVTLGAWPNPQLADQDERCMQEKTMWDVPLLKIGTLFPGDSAVTLYWDPVDLPPNNIREVGFSYGLGVVSGGEGAGKLAVTMGGSFAPRGEFTLTAYVNNPLPGQTVALKLPADFDLVDCEADRAVPPLQPDSTSRLSPVTWKVRGPRQEGRYNLKVQSSTGVSQTQPVTIKLRGIFGG